MDTDTKITFAMFGIIALILLGAVWYMFNQGTVDRLWTNFNKDKFTSNDMVYQTGSVRVYKFNDKNTVCYLADKQSQSVGIYCK